MKILTFWNVFGLGLGVVGTAIIVDALPDTGSATFAQSPLITNVSSLIEQVSPQEGAPSIESLSNLLRIGERTYDVTFDNTVSRTVLSSQTVRKIGFGNESLVSVVSTPSGVYSTDGLASPHVLYPGVTVTQITPPLVAILLKVLVNGEFVDWAAISDSAINL